MNFQPPQNTQDAHQQVLRSAIAGAVFVSEYHRQMGITVEDADDRVVERQLEKLQSALVLSQTTETMSYADYEEPLQELSRIAGKHWNPALGLPESNIAQSITRLNMVGWQVDHEATVLPIIPDIGARAGHLKHQMMEIQADTLTPYQRMVFNADIKATGAATEIAAEITAELEANANKSNQLNGDSASAVTARQLPKLNIEFVDSFALQAWVRSLANLWVLPEDQTRLTEIIDDADRHQRVEKSTAEALTDLWLKDFPWIPRQWAEDASRAVIGSAVSTRLDTLEASAAEIVKAIFDENYDYQESRRKPEQSAEETQRAELHRSLGELSDLLESVREGTPITPEINVQVSEITSTIKAIQEQSRSTGPAEVTREESDKSEPTP